MTKQRKLEKKAAMAVTITRMHAAGEKGPKSTTPVHGKRHTYRSNPEIQKRIAEALKASQPEADKKDKTSAKRILRGAGKASEPQTHGG